MLVLCSACTRHFRVHEEACPFCAAIASGSARTPAPQLWAGASRSRRYAASAAFLATTATFSCGGDTTLPPGAGGASSGQAGNLAGAGGTNGGSAGSSGQGVSGARLQIGGIGPTAGRTGSGGVGATAGAITGNRACIESQERPGCRTSLDCPSGTASLNIYCMMAPPVRGCGNPTFLNRCPPDGCSAGAECKVVDTCGGQECVVPCNDQLCTGGNHCVDGVCTSKPCDVAGGAICGSGFECDPAATTPTRCAPIPCTEGYTCEIWKACSPEAPIRDNHGCAPVACTVDQDCGDCGYCVNERCEPMLGQCYQELPAMPYGCVWPDEELV